MLTRKCAKQKPEGSGRNCGLLYAECGLKDDYLTLKSAIHYPHSAILSTTKFYVIVSFA